MQLSDHCFAVLGLAYHPPWMVNAGFVVGGEQVLVVDSGPTRLAAQTIHGYARLAAPGRSWLVAHTERHFDHLGGSGFFVEQGARIYAHPDCHRTPAEMQADALELNAAIPNPIRQARHEEQMLYAGMTLPAPDIPVTEDTRLDLGGLTVELLLTPGHTTTNLTVFVPAEKVAYVGDTLINGYLPNLEAGGSAEWQQWLVSLDRLEALQARVILPGHGPVLTGDAIPAAFATVRQALHTALTTGRAPTQPESLPGMI